MNSGIDPRLLKADGSKLLKYVSILLIVMAAVNMLFLFSVTTALLNAAAETGIDPWSIISAALLLLNALVMFLAGDAGIRNWKKPEKVKRCWIMGAINLLVGAGIRVANLILDPSSQQLAALLIGLIVPVLYLWGTYKLSNLPVVGSEIVNASFAVEDEEEEE